MIRSLRVRFFLISWPLVVAAIAAVAFGVERWTTVELDRIEAGPRPAGDRARADTLADSVAERWSALNPATLAALVAGADPAPALIVLDSTGTIVAASDSTVRLVQAPESPGGVSRFTRRRADGPGRVAEELIAISGVIVRDAHDRRLGSLYVAPTRHVGESAEGIARRRASLRARIWSIALFASFAAAAAALLLAGPLVTRVRRLTAAAAAIRGGALDTRITDNGADELASLAGSFNAMAASLAEARQLQRSLVSDVAHELRTPLTNVMGLVEAMQDGLVPSDETTLATLRSEIGLLASLVHELQELSLAESGQLALTLESVDAVAACGGAVAAIAMSADGVAVTGPASASPIHVRADSLRLAQVLRNLLRNAITHTPAGGRVTVTVEPRGGTVVIIVADTGRGIPAEHLALVFERFHRVDPSRNRSSGGMGLGLAVVRQFVTAMGGRVFVDSVEGRGSSFGVELPAG